MRHEFRGVQEETHTQKKKSGEREQSCSEIESTQEKTANWRLFNFSSFFLFLLPLPSILFFLFLPSSFFFVLLFPQVARDRIVELWRHPETAPLSVEFGNGYPSDPKSRRFLDSHMDPVFAFPSIVRFSWQTAYRMIDEKNSKCVVRSP